MNPNVFDDFDNFLNSNNPFLEHLPHLALESAIDENNTNAVRNALQKNASVNGACLDGHSPLYAALQKNNPDITVALLEKNAQLLPSELENNPTQAFISLLSFANNKEAIATSENLLEYLQPKISQTLSRAGCSHDFVVQAVQEESTSMMHLISIFSTNKSAEELDQALRAFFLKRWVFMRQSDISYNSFPHSFMNQLCVKLAKKIQKPGETLAKILMPTVTVDEYLLGETLEELTTNPETHEFAPYRFITNDLGNAIIPIEEWFNANIHNEAPLLEQYYTPGPIPLTTAEEMILKNCALPSSEDFFEEFVLRKKLMNDKGTLASEVLHLCDTFMKNGETSKKGTALDAGTAAYLAIIEFSKKWNQLDPKVRDTISNLGVHADGTGGFGYHLNIILKVGGTQGDQSCIEVNSKMMKGILNMHIDAFSHVRFSDQASSSSAPTQQSNSFDDLLGNIMDKIRTKENAYATVCAHPTNQASAEMALNLHYRLARNGEVRLSNTANHYAQSLNQNNVESLPFDNCHAVEFYLEILPKEQFDQLFRKLSKGQINVLMEGALSNNSVKLLNYLMLTTAFPPRFAITKFHEQMLHRAAESGNKHAVTLLLKNKVDVNSQNSYKHTALYLAFHHNHDAIAEILIKAGALPSEQDYSNGISKKKSLLHYAAKLNAPKLLEVSIKLLKQQKISIAHRCPLSRETALETAVRYGHFDIFKILHQEGAQLNNVKLISICAAENNEIMEFYLLNARLNMNPDLPNYRFHGQAFIFYLIKENHLAILNQLHNASYGDYSPNCRNTEDLTPIQYAIHEKKFEVLELFLKSRYNHIHCDRLFPNGLSAAGYCLFRSDMDTLSILLKNKIKFQEVDFQHRDALGNTALHLVAANNRLDIINSGALQQADFNAINHEGSTALHLAAAQGNFLMVSALLANGANFFVKDNKGLTPGDLARQHNHPVVIAVLDALLNQKLAEINPANTDYDIEYFEDNENTDSQSHHSGTSQPVFNSYGAQSDTIVHQNKKPKLSLDDDDDDDDDVLGIKKNNALTK